MAENTKKHLYLKYAIDSKRINEPSLDKDAKHLYLKYKNKYLKLKNMIGGLGFVCTHFPSTCSLKDIADEYGELLKNSLKIKSYEAYRNQLLLIIRTKYPQYKNINDACLMLQIIDEIKKVSNDGSMALDDAIFIEKKEHKAKC